MLLAMRASAIFCPYYVFYNDQLAMVAIPFDTSNYDAVLADLTAKYHGLPLIRSSGTLCILLGPEVG